MIQIQHLNQRLFPKDVGKKNLHALVRPKNWADDIVYIHWQILCNWKLTKAALRPYGACGQDYCMKLEFSTFVTIVTLPIKSYKGSKKLSIVNGNLHAITLGVRYAPLILAQKQIVVKDIILSPMT
jgi:hypothetical protein